MVSYFLLWLSFALVHSVLASTASKQHLQPYLGRFYRLAYNVFSTLHIVVVLIVGRLLLDTHTFSLFSMTFARTLMLLVMLAGFIIMLLALRQYDLGLFGGLAQLRAEESAAQQHDEPLNTAGLNRWVRHPLYSGAMLFLIGNAVSVWGLWTAVYGCLYFLIGSHFEERKLERQYPTDYAEYRRAVPAFIPLFR